MFIKSIFLILFFVSNIYATKFAVINTSLLKLIHKDSGRIIIASLGDLKRYETIDDDKICFIDGYCTYTSKVILVDTTKVKTMKVNTSTCNLYNTPKIGKVYQKLNRGDDIRILTHIKYGWSLEASGKFILSHLIRNYSASTTTRPTVKDILLFKDKSETTTTSKNIDAKLFIRAAKPYDDKEIKEQLNEVVKTVEATKIKDKFYISKISELEEEMLMVKIKLQETQVAKNQLEDIHQKIEKLEHQNKLLLQLLKDR